MPRSHRSHPWQTAPLPWLWDLQDRVLLTRKDYRHGRGLYCAWHCFVPPLLTEIHLPLNNYSCFGLVYHFVVSVPLYNSMLWSPIQTKIDGSHEHKVSMEIIW